jgi:GNAT superfamily N-acetyltransferase
VSIQTAAEPFLSISLLGEQEGSWTHEFEPGGGNLPHDVTREEALANQFFLIDDSTGMAVGTATAWRSRWHAEYTLMMTAQGEVEVKLDGLVHWVAVRPEYQGRGLSKPLLSAVLNCFPDMGCATATLGTSTGRAMAIPLYMKAGFEPLVFHEDEQHAWQDLHARAVAILQDEQVDERTKANQEVVQKLLRSRSCGPS